MFREPGSRNALKLVHHVADALDGQELEHDAVAFRLVERRPDRGPPRTLEIEGIQPDLRFLPQLERGKAGVRVHREALPRHFVEHRPAAVPARKLDEAPDQLRMRIRISDRVVQGDPGAAALAVHQEGVATVGKKQALVAHPHQVRIGQRLLLDNGNRGAQLVGSWPSASACRGARQQPDGYAPGGQADAERCPKAARRGRRELELPP